MKKITRKTSDLTKKISFWVGGLFILGLLILTLLSVQKRSIPSDLNSRYSRVLANSDLANINLFTPIWQEVLSQGTKGTFKLETSKEYGAKTISLNFTGNVERIGEKVSLDGQATITAKTVDSEDALKVETVIKDENLYVKLDEFNSLIAVLPEAAAMQGKWVHITSVDFPTIMNYFTALDFNTSLQAQLGSKAIVEKELEQTNGQFLYDTQHNNLEVGNTTYGCDIAKFNSLGVIMSTEPATITFCRNTSNANNWTMGWDWQDATGKGKANLEFTESDQTFEISAPQVDLEY